MSLKSKMAGKNAALRADFDAFLAAPCQEPQDHEPRTAPGRMLGLQDKIYSAEVRASEAEARLEKIIAEKTNVELRIEELHEVADRRRLLSPEQFNELLENLKHNPLTSPVTVRIRKTGGYEIVAGHNRIEVFKQLGRNTIHAVVLSLDDDEAERSAFYSNLLSPTLPDYEKFLGFSARLRRKKFTHEQLAEEAGVSRTLIVLIMSFGDLPGKALEVIKSVPILFGYNAIHRLAALSKEGKADRVIDAIKLVAEKKLSQEAAVKYAASEPNTHQEKADPTIIRSGKKTYCKVLQRGKDIRISFADEAHISEGVMELLKLLEDQARRH